MTEHHVEGVLLVSHYWGHRPEGRSGGIALRRKSLRCQSGNPWSFLQW